MLGSQGKNDPSPQGVTGGPEEVAMTSMFGSATAMLMPRGKVMLAVGEKYLLLTGREAMDLQRAIAGLSPPAENGCPA